MRFREVLRFELGYQLRQPTTWASLALLLGAPLLLVAGGANPVGTGDRFDAPLKIASFTLFVGLLGTLVTAALFVEAGHRDPRWRSDSFFYTAPLRKGDYLGGRFVGVLLVNALLLLAVPAALLLGTLLPSASAQPPGPFRAQAYLLPYVLLLPNLLVSAAVLFGVTVLSRRSLPGYLGALGLVAAYMVALNASAGSDSPAVLALVDPIGVVALTRLTKGWARVEQNTRLIGLEGVLAWNRLLWTALGAAMLAVTYRRFRLAHPAPAARRRAAPSVAREAERIELVVVPRARRDFGARARLAQTLGVARMGFRHVVLRRDFLLVVGGLLALAASLVDEALSGTGAPIWPRTHEVLPALTGNVVQLVVVLLLGLLAGELVWRDRDAGMDRIGDSAPVPDWVPLVGAFLALAASLVLLQGVLMAAGVLLQLVRGYGAVEPWLYARVLFGMQLADHLPFAALALVVHVLVGQKYVGHVVFPGLYLLVGFARRLGVEHNLLVFGSDAGWSYSDLGGFGPYVAPFVWFKLYWAGWALLLGVVALLFWARGTERGMRARVRLARRRISLRVAGAAAAGALLALSAGGYVFYNTNVLNAYRTGWEADEALAEHERRFERFEHAPRPWLTGITLHADVRPEQRAATLRGTYRLVNRTAAPIDSVHLSSFPDAAVALRSVRFDRPARAALVDSAYGYRIYALDRALAPGDSLRLHFEVEVARRGFRNREQTSANAALVGDFTHLLSRLVLPAVGYQRDLMELSNAETRRRHGLPHVDVRPSLDDSAARRLPRSSPEGDWIDFEGTVSTAGDQIAVLPGTLRRSWTEGGRRHFHYRAESPILNGFALLSARYAVHDDRGPGVPIRVLHHPRHAANVDRAARDARAALDYLAEQFGPYPHRELTLLEFPRYGHFARAYPGQMVFTENHPISLERAGDAAERGPHAPLLFTAHELAHQWWGHQVMGADVRGSQVLSETLAQYSAAMVLERTHGVGAAGPFLRSMQLAYLDGRGSHASPEVPLLLSGDHEYLHYRKGAVVMYALKDYLGEARVNGALRGLVARYGMRGAPYPTSLDLYRELRAVTPDSLRGLLDDLMTTITLWDLRATGARAEPLGDGRYRVTLDVQSAKVRSDSVGNDTPIAMDDLVDVAVFAAAPDGGGAGAPLYLRKHRVRSGAQSIAVTVTGRPGSAAIDPYHKLVARRLEGLLNGTVAAAAIAER